MAAASVGLPAMLTGVTGTNGFLTPGSAAAAALPPAGTALAATPF